MVAVSLKKKVTLSGEGGADELLGSAGADRLLGGADADLLRGGAGADDLDGGPGADLADFSDAPGGGGVTVNLAAGTATGAGSNSLSGITDVTGTPFADSISGDASANALAGAGGNDTIDGGAGADVLSGGADDDLLESRDGGTADSDDCGPGIDVANADVQDATIGCESVTTPGTNQPGGPVDGQAPRLSLSGDKQQKSKKKIVANAVCEDEVCDIEAGGTIKVKIVDKRGKVKKKKTFKLKGDSEQGVAAGHNVKLKLKFDGKTQRKIKKVIKKKASKATVEVTATDQFGNSSGTSKLKVKVKR